MRLVGWPSQWTEEDGIQPVDLQEVGIHASAKELRELAELFLAAANNADSNLVNAEITEFNADFPDPKPASGLPLKVTAVIEDTKP